MPLDLIGTWVAATLTIGILSFLYKDNPPCKAARDRWWTLPIFPGDVKARRASSIVGIGAGSREP